MNEPFQPPLGSREERVAYNQAWSRDLNEQRAEWAPLGDGGSEFRCECWRASCDARIELSPVDWSRVRAAPNRFAVAPGHVAADVEAVIERHSGFWAVEKLGRAGQVAEKLA